MKVTNQHFINKATLNIGEKKITIQFNFPPDTNHLLVTNMHIMSNGKSLENILSTTNPRIGYVVESRKIFIVRLDNIPPIDSIFKIRIKNPKTQDYEDTSFLFDGVDFHKKI